MRNRDKILGLLALGTTLAVTSPRAAPAAAPSPTPAPAEPDASAAPVPAADASDALFELGKTLFDQYAPPAVKAEYEFPSKETWDAFASRLTSALASDSLRDLAQYGPEARSAAEAARTLPGYDDYRDWLEQRLDEIDGANQALAGPPRQTPTPSPVPAPGVGPSRVPSHVGPVTGPGMPYYDLWVSRVRGRPLPPRADTLMPRLRAAFAAEGVPPELAWIAEAESSLNPSARSPAGAKGLFQLTPETARELGLATFLPDQRTDPEKSARAAARYLKSLHERFGNWPLALAAYNAGAGRVTRALAGRPGADFSTVAGSLPAETRMYVPKVCALVSLRTGLSPDRIPPPRA